MPHATHTNTVIWNQQLIQKYDKPVPRYTSYPTAVEFNTNFTEKDFIVALNKYPHRPLSLYLHIPFCHKLCYFCGCNKIVTHDQNKIQNYLQHLLTEIKLRAKLFSNRKITQIHWGGGTPTYLTIEQLNHILTNIKQLYQVSQNAEISIEMDPREISLDYLEQLRQLGFNRISVGIQDFNKEVQKLINREQDEQFIFDLVTKARQLNFASINVDLIYGLPKQTPISFAKTIEHIITLAPDRMSIFNFAYLPNMFSAHKLIAPTDMPSPAIKLQLFKQTIEQLVNANYQFIGMDHFAKQTDELAIAQNQGNMQRNFQGYTTQAQTELIAFGVSAISMIGDSYHQNEKVIKDFNHAIANKGNAIARGFKLTTEDCLRRDIIMRLICDFKLNFSSFEQQYQIDFKQHFTKELIRLQQLQEDGLITIDSSGIKVSAQGRLLIRNIAFCFDSYSQQKIMRFSKAI